ncbi:MAG: DNA recombination protein RmuC [Nevskia sp.]
MNSLDLVILVLVAIAALASVLAAWFALCLRASLSDADRDAARLEALLRDEAAQTRRENAEQSGRQRQELAAALAQFGQTLAAQSDVLGRQFNAKLEAFARQLDGLGKRVDERQQAMLVDAGSGREQQANTLHRFGESMAQQLGSLSEANAQRMQELRATVETRLAAIQADNTAKLEEMRRTVDEKLNVTLEARLGEAFSRVSERLEQVQRGLGEMQSLAAGVDGLKRVLTGVKTRGMWGEVQLGNLLEQILSIEQYEANRATRPGSAERVEYAIKLPGRDADDQPVWLPIDAKFPREDYERLLDAQDRGDAEGVAEAGRQLETQIRNEAKKIRDKYIEPPHTTDFALMFLPTEGLYAEVIRRPGLSEVLQREYRVTVAGPTTLTALLNSLQMGFRTLAIQKRSSEVWTILGAVKTEFSKFGDVLDKVKKKLDEASNQIDETGKRSRAIERRLRGVEALPAAAGTTVVAALPLDEDDPA